MTHGATKGQISGLFLTSVEGKGANSIYPPWKFCRVPWYCEHLLRHYERGPPLPCIYFLSQTAQNHKNQRWLLRSQPSDSPKTQPKALDGRTIRTVSLLLLTQVCLPGSIIPISLPRNLCSPQIYALGGEGIYGVFITHPTPGHSTSPCSCQNHPLVPSRVSSRSLRGNSSEIVPSSGPKVLPNCPSPGDKNAKYNIEWKTEVRLAQRVGWGRSHTLELRDRGGLADAMLLAVPSCALALEMWGVDGVTLLDLCWNPTCSWDGTKPRLD